LINLL